MKEAEWRLAAIKGSVDFACNEYDAMKGADALVVITEWNQFRNLDLDTVKKLLKAPAIFDLRNIYRRFEVQEKGLRYFGVGTP